MAYEADLADLIDVTQSLFPVELATKCVVALVEAVYIWRGVGAIPRGCTPGKLLMSIRVIRRKDVQQRSAPETIALGVDDHVRFGA